MHYVMKILLDLIKAYDLIQRNQVLEIVGEEHSVATAGMVAPLLQSSTVMNKGGDSKLKKVVNVGLTQGVLASPTRHST